MTAQAGDTASLFRRKAALRQQLRARRRSIAPAQRRRAARAAACHLARACRRWQVRAVAVYLGLPEEIDTAPLVEALRHQGCALYVPKLAGNQLQFARLGRVLRRNRYGIAEPAALQRPARLDLIVLPLVAFDAGGRRLGMGGGYYDRFLAARAALGRPLRVGFAFAAQEVAAVPAGAGDARLDAIVTERGLRRLR